MFKKFIFNNYFEDSVLVTFYFNNVGKNFIFLKFFVEFVFFFSCKSFFFLNFEFQPLKVIEILKKSGLKKFQKITKFFEVVIFSQIIYGKLSKNTIKNFIFWPKFNQKLNLKKEIRISIYFNFFLKNITVSKKLWKKKYIYEILQKILSFEIKGNKLKFFIINLVLFLKSINKRKKCIYLTEIFFLRMSVNQKINFVDKVLSQTVLPSKNFLSLNDHMDPKKTQIRCLIILNTNILKISLCINRYNFNNDFAEILKNKLTVNKNYFFVISSVLREIIIFFFQNNHFRFIRRLETLHVSSGLGIKNQNSLFFSTKLNILKQLNLWILNIFLKSIYILDFLVFKKAYINILFRNQEKIDSNSLNLLKFLINNYNKNITFHSFSSFWIIKKNSSDKMGKANFAPDQKIFFFLGFVFSYYFFIRQIKKQFYLKYGGKENILKKLMYNKDLHLKIPSNFLITNLKEKKNNIESKFLKKLSKIKQKSNFEIILKQAYFLLETLKNISFCTKIFSSFVRRKLRTIDFFFFSIIINITRGKRKNTKHSREIFKCFSIFMKINVFLKNFFFFLRYTKNNLKKIKKTFYLYFKNILNFSDKDLSFLTRKKILNTWINDFFLSREFALKNITEICKNIRYKDLNFTLIYIKKKLTNLRKSYLLKNFRKITKK